MGTKRRWVVRGVVGVVLLFGLLSIPDAYPAVPAGPGADPFVWGRDELWKGLEARFLAGGDCLAELPGRARIDALLADLPAADDPRWQQAEDGFFEAAASLRQCPEKLEELLEHRRLLRIAARDASRGWPRDAESRNRLYRLLYGTRAAVEELLLQMPEGTAPAISYARGVQSSTPFVEIESVQVHSGDLLLSRGGAPTSAFIARGSDYPGNFSHVALVHVDETTSVVSVIEAHIERGVTIAGAEQYFADKKLRILVLRMRPTTAEMLQDPLLPHKAATAALREAKGRHIPYDFAMDIDESEKRFCSEVASAAYRGQGIELWQNLSTFSSAGLARWMAGFGVENLETHGPSDLEYDPQLDVVAEWHDPETLFDDHVDNAVIDAMLEDAEKGGELGHDALLLPVARLVKAYSVALNLFGAEGPIPEGMSATIALRAEWLAERHAERKAGVLAQVDAFRDQHGYTPPYWALVEMAR